MSGPGPSRHVPSTTNEAIQLLLDSHLATPSLTVPYLHAYTSRKGKNVLRPLEQQELLDRVLGAITASRQLVEQHDTTRLVLSLREIIDRPSPLHLEHAPVINPLLLSLSPVDLLKRISTDIGIQSYLEDSQFGLLKQSIALAGDCFVIDIDLEYDAVGDAPAPDMQAVRLTKITANHVQGESSVRSEWLARVLKSKIEAYLAAATVHTLKALDEALRELKELDELAHKGVIDWFSELERVATEVQESCPDPHLTVFPSFTLWSDRSFHVIPSHSSWFLEYTGPGDGVVVNRSWQTDAPGTIRWEGLARVEQLIVRPATFTYATYYPHRTPGLKQIWSMPSPGPIGLILGHVPMPRQGGLSTLLNQLRNQMIMSEMITRLFLPGLLSDDDDTEPALPISVRLHAGSLELSMPCPHADAMLILQATPDLLRTGITFTWRLIGEVSEEQRKAIASEVERLNASTEIESNLVDVVYNIEKALG